MRRIATLATALLLAACATVHTETAPAAAASHGAGPADPHAAQQAAIQGLVDGNARFVAGKQAPSNLGEVRRKELTKGQHPQAAILSCSDSRVPPEYVFDQQLGDVFVVRTAGNVADAVALGSLEYAVEHLDVPVIVVLGHRSCGAVKATLEAHEKHAHVHGNIGEVVKLVEPAVLEAEKAKAPDLLNASIDANAALEAKALVERSPVIAELVKAGKVRIATAIYDLESGKVVFAN
jgi:carbonic anhydrase